MRHVTSLTALMIAASVFGILSPLAEAQVIANPNPSQPGNPAGLVGRVGIVSLPHTNYWSCIGGSEMTVISGLPQET